jgi:hypothetical protein
MLLSWYAALLLILLVLPLTKNALASTVSRFHHDSSVQSGLYIVVGTGKIGDDVRACLRSLAVNAPGTNVILITDATMWKHLQAEITAGVQGLNLVVLNYEKVVATSPIPFYEVASARFYCIAHVLREVLSGPQKYYRESAFAFHNATTIGIPRKIGVVLTSDSRDVMFQRDPFKQFWFEANKIGEHYKDRGLFVVSEEGRRLVQQCAVNREWVDVCFGKSVAPALGNVLCSGSFMASPRVFLSFLEHAMIPAMKRCRNPMHGFDQGVFNTLVHFPFYSNNSKEELNNVFVTKEAQDVLHLAQHFFNVVNPVVVYSGVTSGWMSTMGASFFDDDKMRLMNRNSTTLGRPCALCHQFDRSKPWTRRFTRLYNEPLNTALPNCTWEKDVYGLGDTCIFQPQDFELQQQVQAVLKKEKKIPLCIGVLAYQGPRTLANTLYSHERMGLLNMVEESMLLFQEINNPKRQAYADFFVKNYTQFNRPPIIEPTNTVFQAFGKIARTCTAKYVMVLEEDFALYVNDEEEVAEELLAAIYLIEHRNMSAVRMRRRRQMGEPDYFITHTRQCGEKV